MDAEADYIHTDMLRDQTAGLWCITVLQGAISHSHTYRNTDSGKQPERADWRKKRTAVKH